MDREKGNSLAGYRTSRHRIGEHLTKSEPVRTPRRSTPGRRPLHHNSAEYQQSAYATGISLRQTRHLRRTYFEKIRERNRIKTQSMPIPTTLKLSTHVD